MKASQLRQLIREEIQEVLGEENTGLITFEQLKQACVKNYIEGTEDLDDYDYRETTDGINEAEDIDDLINMLDGLGFNGYEAYDFIFDSILK
jgi:hypothetical protein